MELYQLKTFKAVAEEGNLTRAAGRLNASQPSVSAHIKSLEEEMGVRLFNRSRKGMQLTREGCGLLIKAEAVLSSMADLVSEARRMQGELSGCLRIGLNGNPVFLRTREFFSAMRCSHPAIALQLTNSNSQCIVKYLKLEVFDGGYVLWDEPHPEIETIFLDNITTSIVAPPAWGERLAGGGLSATSGLPWIISPRGCSFRKIADELFEAHDITPSNVILADDCATSVTLLSAEAGLSVMETDRAEELAEKGQAVIVSGLSHRLDLRFAYLGKRREDPQIAAMLEVIREIWGAPDES